MSADDDDDVADAVVVDNGTWMCKAGFAGAKTARAYVRTVIGRESPCDVQKEAAKGEYIGDADLEEREMLALSYPMERGEVTNWDHMETFWEYIFKHELRVSVEERAMLITEIPSNTQAHRQRLVETLMEKFHVPALYVTDPASLALYSSGRNTGVVLDVGGSVTHTAAMIKGMPVGTKETVDDSSSVTNNAPVCRSNIGGDDVSKYVMNELQRIETGITFKNTLTQAESVKHSMCSDPTADHYTLPDGTVVGANDKLHGCADVLFSPSLIGSEAVGIDKVLLDALSVSDPAIRKQLCSNIIISGGATLTPGMVVKLTSKLEAAYPGMEVKVIAPPERRKSSWLGGSIVASLSEFSKMCKTRQDYEESGWRDFLTFGECDLLKQ